MIVFSENLPGFVMFQNFLPGIYCTSLKATNIFIQMQWATPRKKRPFGLSVRSILSAHAWTLSYSAEVLSCPTAYVSE